MVSLPAVVDSVLQTIGRTPLLRLRRLVPAGSADVIVKLEYFNPTGSYKDRMALAMIEGAERAARSARHARRRIHRRQHRVVAGDGLRDEGLRLPSALIGRVRGGEARHDARVRRGSERSCRATAARSRLRCSNASRRGSRDAGTSRTRSGPISSTTPMRSTATPASAASWSSRPAASMRSVGAVGTAGMLVGVSQALKAGRLRRAHRCARAVDLAVSHGRQGWAASRRGHGGRLPAATSDRRLVRRGARHR